MIDRLMAPIYNERRKKDIGARLASNEATRKAALSAANHMAATDQPFPYDIACHFDALMEHVLQLDEERERLLNLQALITIGERRHIARVIRYDFRHEFRHAFVPERITRPKKPHQKYVEGFDFHLPSSNPTCSLVGAAPPWKTSWGSMFTPFSDMWSDTWE
jgi:hypothetical protein